MIVAVRLFARARDLAGADRVTVTLPDGATVGQLRQEVAARYPALAVLVERSLLAVNEDYAGDAASLTPDSEVALLPPVSGG